MEIRFLRSNEETCTKVSMIVARADNRVLPVLSTVESRRGSPGTRLPATSPPCFDNQLVSNVDNPVRLFLDSMVFHELERERNFCNRSFSNIWELCNVFTYPSIHECFARVVSRGFDLYSRPILTFYLQESSSSRIYVSDFQFVSSMSRHGTMGSDKMKNLVVINQYISLSLRDIRPAKQELVSKILVPTKTSIEANSIKMNLGEEVHAE